MAPPVRLLPQEERWSTTGQVLQKGQPFHNWTWTRCCRNVLPDSMVFAAWEETLWVYTHYLSSLFCFYRSDILSINRRAEPAHVYPTAAKLTIKSLIMSIEFILITTIWVSYQNEAILNNRQRSVTLVATAKTRLTVRRFRATNVLQECTCPPNPLTVHSTQLHLGQCDTRSVWHTWIPWNPIQLAVGPLKKRTSSKLSPKGGPGSYKTQFLSSGLHGLEVGRLPSWTA